MSICITLLFQLAAGLEMRQPAAPKTSASRAPILLVRTYVNNKEHKHRIRAKDVILTSRTQVFVVRDSAGLLILPRIEKTDTLALTVQIGHRSACMKQIPGWRLQPGANVSIGRLNDWAKVVSIAKQNEMLPIEDDYTAMNNSYAVAPAGTVIDIPDITRFRYVDYMTLIGYGHGTEMDTWQGKLK